ncbi:hypothetical protein MMC30_004001 [Trapelia coarctata]|nr:hypothetical protein [Trapelia coarctata]
MERGQLIGLKKSGPSRLFAAMKNSQYQVTFGVEIEFVFVFHEKLILAELLNSVEGQPRKPNGNFREGREHDIQLQRVIQKWIPDVDRLKMNQAPVQYSDFRPRYLAWAVMLDYDETDATIKTNDRPKRLLRTYGREPIKIAKEVLRSGAQNQDLEYWDPAYPDDITVDAHLGPGKPTHFTNWHLIPEPVVEAHTQNALQAYLEQYKRCSDRDGSEPPQSGKRPHDRDSSDDERLAKRFKSTIGDSASPVRRWVTAPSQSSTHNSNQENIAPSPSSHPAQPTQLPSSSFGSINASSDPANPPPTPNSQQLHPSFQIYKSPSSSARPGNAQRHQPGLGASPEVNTSPERPSYSPLSTIEEQDEESQSVLGASGQQGHSSQLQQHLVQENRQRRNQIQQNLMARNPLMQLQPQLGPSPQMPPGGSLDISGHEHQGSRRPAQPVVPNSNSSSDRSALMPTPMLCTQFTVSPEEMSNLTSSKDSNATEDDPNLPSSTNSNEGYSFFSPPGSYAKSLTPGPPGLKVNEWDSHGMELVSRVLTPSDASFREIQILCNRLKGNDCSHHGATASPKAGLHVHLKCADGDIDLLTLQHLLYILVMYERHINTLHPPHRRPNSSSDTAINELASNTDNFLKYFDESGPEEPGLTAKELRRRDLSLKDIRAVIFARGMDVEGVVALAGGEESQIVNFTWLSRDHPPDAGKRPRTLEFRQHESVLRGDMIQHWVAFCSGLLRLANYMAWGNVPAGKSRALFRGNRKGEGYWVEEWSDSMSVWDLMEQMELDSYAVTYFMRRAAYFEGFYGGKSGMGERSGEGEWEEVEGVGCMWRVWD